MKSYLAMVFLFLSYLVGVSQDRIIQFQTLSYEDGISDNRIAKILQDQNGYMWFCNRLGIEQYNGSTVKTYQLPKGHIEINDIIQDRKGRIWVATRIGLFFLNEKTDVFEQWSPSDPALVELVSGPMIALLQPDMDYMLCSAENGSIIEISFEDRSAKILHQIPPRDIGGQNRGDYGSTLYMDTESTVWIGTRYGKLIRFKDSEFTEMGLQGNSDYITAIARDRKDQLWVGTSNNGLFAHNLKTSVSTQYSTHSKDTALRGINNNYILDLAVDAKNNVWIGTDGGGLNLYVQADNEFTSFKHNRYNDFPIADNSILNIYLGSDNIIWLGTVHGGISYFKNDVTLRQLLPPTIGFELMDKQSSRILEASNGDIWFTFGRNGLRRYRPGKGNVSIFLDDPNNKNDLSGNNVLELYEDNRNRIWIGTFDGGLNVYDTKTETFLIPENQSESKAIFAMAGDAQGHIWVGSDTGIKVYSPDLQLKHRYNTQNVPNLRSNMITSLYKDIKGDMWVGTISGLYVFKKDTVIAYNSMEDDPSSISGDRILAITEDDDLSILIGTYGYGLNRYLRGEDKFERIGKKDGLDGNIVYGISVDPDKNLWCSTNKGLSKISRDGTIANYNILNGIPSFNGGSAIIHSQGYILMGSTMGLSYFKASELSENHSPAPKVFFTKGTILNDKGVREIKIGYKGNDNIVLEPQDDLVSIYFSNSNYWNPQSSDYSYILEGLNKGWQNIGNQQVLTFTNLKPGEYTLKVSTANNPDYEATELAIMKITVRPSFLQRIWVQASLGIGGSLLILLLFKWRISTIQNQRERLQILVDTKTAEIKREQKKVYQGEIALLKAEKDNQSLSRKKLKEDLDFKTGELTNYTLRTVHKNHLLNNIKDLLLNETKGKTPNKENLRKIIGLIEDSFLLDEDWETFYDLFNQIHTTFVKNLKAYDPKLTDREIRLCALIKLNFSSQHMATLFGISLSSVKVARHRLRKKLNIKENETYEDFFRTLEATSPP